MNQPIEDRPENSLPAQPIAKTAPRLSSLIDTMVSAGRFASFIACVRAAELDETMNTSGSLTVFAPTDDAFKKLPAGAYEALRKNTGKLKAILNYHIVSGYWMTRDLKSGEVMTLQGSKLALDISSAGLKINEAKAAPTDVLALNGVVHAIDTLLLPKNWRLTA